MLAELRAEAQEQKKAHTRYLSNAANVLAQVQARVAPLLVSSPRELRAIPRPVRTSDAAAVVWSVDLTEDLCADVLLVASCDAAGVWTVDVGGEARITFKLEEFEPEPVADAFKAAVRSLLAKRWPASRAG